MVLTFSKIQLIYVLPYLLANLICLLFSLCLPLDFLPLLFSSRIVSVCLFFVSLYKPADHSHSNCLEMEYLDSVGEYETPRNHGFEGLAFFVFVHKENTRKILPPPRKSELFI